MALGFEPTVAAYGNNHTHVDAMSLYDDIVLGTGSVPEGQTYEEYIRDLTARNEELSRKLKGAQDDASVLEKNISCLFATAKLEIKRKDEEISRLRELVEIERGNAAIQQEAIRQLLLQLKDAAARLPTDASALRSATQTEDGVRAVGQSLQLFHSVIVGVPERSALADELQCYRSIQAHMSDAVEGSCEEDARTSALSAAREPPRPLRAMDDSGPSRSRLPTVERTQSDGDAFQRRDAAYGERSPRSRRSRSPPDRRYRRSPSPRMRGGHGWRTDRSPPRGYRR